MHKIILILSIFAIFALSACANTQKDPQSALTTFDPNAWPSLGANTQDAQDLWAKGLLTQALQALENNNDAQAELLRGELYYSKAMFPEAYTHFMRFISQTPQHEYSSWAVLRMIRIALLTTYDLDYQGLCSINAQALPDEAKAYFPVLAQLALERATDAQASPLAPLPMAIHFTHWRWVGPFASRVLPSFNDPLPPDADDILQEQYLSEDQVLKTQQGRADTPETTPSLGQGLYYLETSITLQQDTDFVLSAISSNLYKLYIDEILLIQRGPADLHGDTAAGVVISLPQGSHRIRVKIHVLEPQNQALSLFLLPQNQALATINYSLNHTPSKPFASPPQLGKKIDLLAKFPSDPKQLAQYPFIAWLYANYALMSAKHYLAGVALKASLQNHDFTPSSLLLIERYSTDPHITPSLANDYAMDAAQAAIDAAPQNALAIVTLIKFLLRISPQQASDALLRYGEALPANADTHILKYQIAKALGWQNEAYRAMRDAFEANPSCALVGTWLEMQMARNKVYAPQELPDTLQSCPLLINFYANNVYAPLRSTENFQNAFNSLQKRYPPKDFLPLFTPAFLRLDESKNASELVNTYYDDKMIRSLQSHELVDVIDPILSRDTTLASSVLQKFINALPSDMALRNIQNILQNKSPLQELRKDGLQIVRDYLAQNPTDSFSAFYILDYAAYHYFEDGSALSVTHQISRILNKEGKNLLGEVYLPANAIVTQIRTIKHATLQSISPENIAHKESITMPKLDDGDFIEVEYFLADAPVRDSDNAFYVPTWFFKTTDAPLLHSEFIIQYPKTIKPLTEIRNAAPQISCKTIENYEQCRYRMDNQTPPASEPYSPNDLNLLPNLQIAYKLDLQNFINALNNQIFYATLPTPYLQEALLTIFPDTPDNPKSDTLSRAQNIYAAIQDKIAEKDQFFATSASQTWNTKAGSRIALLKALYDLAQIPNDVVIIVPQNGPQKIEALTPTQFFYPYLRAHIDSKDYYIDPTENFTPFGFLTEDLQNRPAYRLSTDNPQPFQTPQMPDSEYVSQVHLQLTINQDGSLAASGHETLLGSRAIKLRTAFNELKNDQNRLWRILENSMSNSYGLAKISRLDYRNLQQTSLAFELDYDFSAPDYASINDAGLSILPKTLAYDFIASLATLQERKNPLILSESLSTQRTVSFLLPTSYLFTSPPQNITLNTPFGSYSRSQTLQKNELHIQETLSIRPQRIEVKDYPAFRDFLKQIDDAQSLPITAVKQHN